MFEKINFFLDKELVNHFKKVNEIVIFDSDGLSYYIFYKPYDEMNITIIYDPYEKVILKTCGESNAILERYLLNVRDGDTSLISFCLKEDVELILNNSGRYR